MAKEAEMLTRTLWRVDKLLDNAGMDGREEVYTEAEAILVSSRLLRTQDDNLHAPVFDIDFNLVAYPDGAATWLAFEGLKVDLPNPPGFDIDDILGDVVKTEVDHHRISHKQWLAFAMRLIDLGIVEDAAPPWGSHLNGRTLKFIVPIRVIPSSSADHFHLYINHALTWPEYRDLIELTVPGILNPGFAKNSIARQMTMVIRPGLNKAKLAEMGIEVQSSQGGNREASDGLP